MSVLSSIGENGPTALAIALGIAVGAGLLMPVCTLFKRGIGMGYLHRALAMGMHLVPLWLSMVPVFIAMPLVQGKGWPGTIAFCIVWLVSFLLATVVWTYSLGRFSTTRELLDDGAMLMGDGVKRKGLNRVGS